MLRKEKHDSDGTLGMAEWSPTPLQKMPGKKVVVDGDIFHANSVRAVFDFEDAIAE